MPKFVIRISSLLLISALVADPTANALSVALSNKCPVPSEAEKDLFEKEALLQPMVSAWLFILKRATAVESRTQAFESLPSFGANRGRLTLLNLHPLLTKVFGYRLGHLLAEVYERGPGPLWESAAIGVLTGAAALAVAAGDGTTLSPGSLLLVGTLGVAGEWVVTRLFGQQRLGRSPAQLHWLSLGFATVFILGGMVVPSL